MLKKYKNKKHPLEYKNDYQLLVMVLLAARDKDNNINTFAPTLFEAFPDIKTLSKATEETLIPYIGKVRSAFHKADWLMRIAARLKGKPFPSTHAELTELEGIGSKSANVILREMGKPAEGVMVDLHTVRVAPRLGIATGADPKKIEKQLKEILPQNQWDAGMAMSFHGREICRPTPKCDICFMTDVCEYFKANGMPPNVK